VRGCGASAPAGAGAGDDGAVGGVQGVLVRDWSPRMDLFVGRRNPTTSAATGAVAGNAALPATRRGLAHSAVTQRGDRLRPASAAA
jgi:hypothetical protein